MFANRNVSRQKVEDVFSILAQDRHDAGVKARALRGLDHFGLLDFLFIRFHVFSPLVCYFGMGFLPHPGTQRSAGMRNERRAISGERPRQTLQQKGVTERSDGASLCGLPDKGREGESRALKMDNTNGLQTRI